jgi:transposase
MRLCYAMGMAQTVCSFLSAEDRQRLAAILADRNRPQKHAARVRIILHSAERLDLAAVARRAGLSRAAVWRWQQRFAEAGVDGLLRDRTRQPGKARTPAATVQRVVALTRSEPPGAATHWTGRMMAAAVGLSLRTVQRIWAAHQLQPHRLRSFKRSRDPVGGAASNHHQARGHCRALPGAAAPRGRAVGRRDLSRRADQGNPGPRPHAAGPAAQARQGRDHDARLYPPCQLC